MAVSSPPTDPRDNRRHHADRAEHDERDQCVRRVVAIIAALGHHGHILIGLRPEATSKISSDERHEHDKISAALRLGDCRRHVRRAADDRGYPRHARHSDHTARNRIPVEPHRDLRGHRDQHRAVRIDRTVRRIADGSVGRAPRRARRPSRSSPRRWCSRPECDRSGS